MLLEAKARNISRSDIRPAVQDPRNFTNERLGAMTTQDRIGWMYRSFDPRKIVLTTSGGDTSAILPTLVSKTLRTKGNHTIFPIVFVDTLLNGKSTLDFVEGLSERGNEEGYEVLTYKPLVTLDELSQSYPEWDTYGSDDFKKAKHILKIEPLDRAFQELGAACWASGPMRWEAPPRANMPIFDRRKDGLYVVHPIVDWTKIEADKYIVENRLPSNPNHYDFFKGPDQKMECGIHTR